MNNKPSCVRCGCCCENMGTVWLNSDHPRIKELYKIWPDDGFSDGGRCTALGFVGDTSYCMI